MQILSICTKYLPKLLSGQKVQHIQSDGIKKCAQESTIKEPKLKTFEVESLQPKPYIKQTNNLSLQLMDLNLILLQSMFTPEVPKHPACLSIWLESLFEHIDYRVTVVKNDPRNRKKEKNGAPQNWFFSASMSLHLFEWLSLSSTVSITY